MPIKKFETLYKIEFTTILRGHHAYQNDWTSAVGSKLSTAPDERTEAKGYDQFSVGVYHLDTLVGHVPIELSPLVHTFIDKDECQIEITVAGKRKREVGLVLPAKYTALTSSKEKAEIFSKN